MSKLGFVIPVYRTERFLPKCIRHLKDQSLKDWEAVFVLDGPSSEAEGIIRAQMAGHKFSVYEIPHSGACAARNYGFNALESGCENVIFWDSDTYIEPDAAMNWVQIFDSHPDIGFIYSGYKFEGNEMCYDSEPFDPWLLRVRNYISTMNPIRKNLAPKWDESLKSLQDWDFWLTAVENGVKAKYLHGYAWSTEPPTKESISGINCKRDVWIDRVSAIKKKHNLPDRKTCVASILHKEDAVQLAKIIDADYQDNPEIHPHCYDRIIQVGFGFQHGVIENHAKIFCNPATEKFLFWSNENISELWNGVNLSAIDKYGILLNGACKKMFCEDLTAQKLLRRAGFDCEILPIPIQSDGEIKPIPEGKPKFVVDASEQYGYALEAISKNMPDIDMELLSGPIRMNDYVGLIHLHLDKTLSSNVKRTLLSGRYVISNIQQPFCGFVEDNQEPERFMLDMCKKMRSLIGAGVNRAGHDYYKALLSADNLLEALCRQEVAA